mmetsp:Transcript_68671/g.129538  ORF Transcript_68671/g.129538 Transcript_68671/m.129538 type:complete len:231 (+) Transcript_68671:114-806(+)
MMGQFRAMASLACFFGLSIGVAAAKDCGDCGHCVPGYFSDKPRWMCAVTPATQHCPSACKCVEKNHGDGVFCPSDQKCKDDIWVPGQGDIVSDIHSSCSAPGYGSNGTISTQHGGKGRRIHLAHTHIAKVTGSGKLEGMHRQLDLGRPGRCAADAFVRLLGETLKQADGQLAVFEILSVGECCDKCLETNGCVGWNSHQGICSLLSSVSGSWEHQSGSFSGVHRAALVAV